MNIQNVLITGMCIKSVDEKKMCIYCEGQCVKNGKTRSNKQRLLCRICNRTFLTSYRNIACYPALNTYIIKLLKEGCGVQSIVRLLRISSATLIKRIKSLADNLNKRVLHFHHQYEVDELCTYVGCKTNRIWIAYAYCRETRSVVDFVIGTRSKLTLEPLINKLLSTVPKQIYTDKHQTYASLIPDSIHSTKYRGTNHIERKNLTLRTHLKRLSRRTICFSKSLAMLQATLMIYFFG
ncbi:IS1 family transposase [Edaphocola aurantiacus]|uniref:IS1 family transposase n=1 Tax=Edaphocola aurantiacus TaxID=2601682 RepID=UPI001C961C48